MHLGCVTVGIDPNYTVFFLSKILDLCERPFSSNSN